MHERDSNQLAKLRRLAAEDLEVKPAPQLHLTHTRRAAKELPGKAGYSNHCESCATEQVCLEGWKHLTSLLHATEADLAVSGQMLSIILLLDAFAPGLSICKGHEMATAWLPYSSPAIHLIGCSRGGTTLLLAGTLGQAHLQAAAPC